MSHQKVSNVLRLIPFTAFVDCISTFYGLFHGGEESFPFPKYVLLNWGSIGLIIYSLLIFSIFQCISHFLIIRPLNNTYRPRSVSLMAFLAIIVYYAGFSYWSQIVVMNFLLPFDIGINKLILRYAIEIISAFLLFLYTKDELLPLIR